MYNHYLLLFFKTLLFERTYKSLPQLLLPVSVRALTLSEGAPLRVGRMEPAQFSLQ